MPRTEKRYPEWVQNYRTRGTTVKKESVPDHSIGSAQNTYSRKIKSV